MKTAALIILLLIASCSPGKEYDISIEQSGMPVVTGRFDRSVIQSDSAMRLWYTMRYDEYTVDTALIPVIASHTAGLRFVVVAGTWCGDSKRELPHLYKILDAAHIPEAMVELYGVDRSKKGDDGIAEKYAVTLVPTIIVLRGEKELGRIVEMPQETLEADLVKIVKQQ